MTVLRWSSACAAWSMSGLASAATIHVDAATGDDANDGLAPATAVATLTRAAEIVAAGDEVIVGPGVYYERPEFAGLGSSEALPVWIHAEPRGRRR
jgi:hypothetical protein